MINSGNRNVLLQAVVATAAAAFLVLVVFVVLGFRWRSQVTERICEVQITDRKALRGSFVIARNFTLTSPVRSAYERERVAAFYTLLLSHTPALECVGGKPVQVTDGN